MWSQLKCRLDFPLVYYRNSREIPISPAEPAISSHLLQTPSNDLGEPAEEARKRDGRDRVSWWCKLGLHAWHRHEAKRRPGSFVSRCRKCQRVVVRRRNVGGIHSRPDVATATACEARFDENRKVIPLESYQWLSDAPLRHPQTGQSGASQS